MKSFKLIGVLVAFTFFLNGCTSNKPKYLGMNKDNSCNSIIYEHQVENKYIYDNLYKPHSKNLKAFTEKYKNIETVYFENIKGAEPHKTVFITKDMVFRAKYKIEFECSGEIKLIRHDANIKTELSIKKGFASLESKITLHNGQTHTVKTDLKHNHIKL
jgi:hypothetical protein